MRGEGGCDEVKDRFTFSMTSGLLSSLVKMVPATSLGGELLP